MSKDRLYNQLEQLFSTTQVVPAADTPQPELPSAPLQPAPSKAEPRREVKADMDTRPVRRARAGWNDFLDGIRRKRSFGYVYDSTEVRPLDGISKRPGRNALSFPLHTAGETFGRLVLEDESQSWTENQRRLVSAVADRLSQQVDNLRLLDEAERYRKEAEQTLAQMSQKGWEDFLVDEQEEDLIYVYDQSLVKPGSAEDAAAKPELSVPLAVRDNVLGEVQFNGIENLDTDSQNLLAAVTQQLSSHLDNLRLNEQRETSLAEVEGLYSISAELSAATTLKDALMAVAQPAIATGAKRCSLFRVVTMANGKPEEMELVAHWEQDGSGHMTPLGMRFKMAEMPGTDAWVNNLDKPFMMPDASIFAPPDVAGARSQADFKGFLLLPLKGPDGLIGIIIANFADERIFSQADERLYSALAQQAAVVVNNLFLFEQATRRATDMETVAIISTAISRLLDPDLLLKTVVEETQKGFSVYHSQIYVYDKDMDALVLSASSGNVGEKLLAKGHFIPMSAEHSLVARVARNREEIIVGDTGQEPDFLPNELLQDTRAEIALPMIVGDQMLGVFDVQDSRLNRFTQLERQIFMTLTSQVAVALQNARLYLEQAETVERLRELDHLKSDFLANMSHELRTPLNSIMGFTDVILLGLDGPVTDQMENDLHLVEKNGKHLLSLINNVLDMSKIEAGRMTLSLEKFDLQSLIEEATDIVRPLAREKSLVLDLVVQDGEAVELEADRVRMRQVMINVLGNAVKFTETGGINILVWKTSVESVRIEVKDTGLGIPPNKLDMIFESFSQVDTTSTRKVGGTGLGLSISRSLVGMHGGRLWAESTGVEGEGSTFIIELPLKGNQEN
jgi:signal transduction histidine kinase